MYNILKTPKSLFYKNNNWQHYPSYSLALPAALLEKLCLAVNIQKHLSTESSFPERCIIILINVIKIHYRFYVFIAYLFYWFYKQKSNYSS